MTRSNRAHVVCFTSFPPPLTGQNVMADQVARWADEVAMVTRIDTAATSALSGGRGHARRMLRRWSQLHRVLRQRPSCLYIVLSSSRLGRIRDGITLAIARGRVARIVGHIQVGDFAESVARWRWGSARLLRAVDAVLVLSARLAPAIEAHAQPGAVRVVPNTAPDVEATVDERRRKRADRARAVTFRVAFVANLLEGKGHDVLLAGVAAYRATPGARPIELDIVGRWQTPSERAAFEAEASRLGLGDRVRIHGEVRDRAWIKALYLDADVVALPSRYRHEALPLCLVEALATATPVIGTDHGAISDLVTSDTGVLLADRRPDTIADALRQLADPDRWVACSRGAEALYQQRFSSERVRALVLQALGLDAVADQGNARSA